jgi:outer membrane protein assembly factor BamB/class 3 adenylate cyclase
MTASPASTRGFLFADLRDYTQFVETHGDDAAAGLLKAYRVLMRDVIARFGAAEIKTEGDSFYIVFPSASSAIEGGLAILAAAAEATGRDPDHPIRVGIGVHAGETEELAEGPVGLAVNIAARVCARAKPGELWVTDTVRALTRTRMSVRFVSRGSPKLKGIAEPIALYAVESGTEPAVPPRRRMRSVVIATGLVGVAVIAAAAILVIGRPGHTPFTAGAGLPCAPASATPPPITDVPEYRADVARTSVYPGPGPQCQPQLVWQKQLGAVANFVPIVVSGKVVVGDQDGLHAFDARTGKAIWTLAGSDGFAESALADSGVIYAADLGGSLHAIDATTGTERWVVRLPNNGIRPTIAAGFVWVGSSDGHAYALDPSTGEERWRWDGPADKPVTVDLVGEDAAYVVSGGTVYAIRLIDRTELWHHDTGAKAVTGPVMAGNTIYIAARPEEGGTGGALFALDRRTGKNRWRPFAIPSGHQVTPGPTRDAILYVTADDGVYALRDKGSEYQILWHNEDLSFSWRPASLAGNVLYVQQNESTLVALRADTGKAVWSTPSGMNGEEAPVVTGGLVFQVDAEGSILRAWAEPGLAAKLGATSAPSASASASQLANPFTLTSTFPWFETGIQVPAAMDVGPDGLLYVLHAKADYSNPQVTAIDPKTGRPVRSWGRYGSGQGELDLTSSGGNGPGGCIQVAPDGLIYVGERANKRVEVFTKDGKLVRQIGVGQLGLGLFCQLGPDGSLYTSGDTDGVITKFSVGGKLLWQRVLDPAHSNYAFQVHGIAVQRDGKILGFTDGTGHAVTLDPTTGKVIRQWGQPGSTPGKLGLSGEPSLDAAGNIYVFQYVPQAIQVFDPKGRLLGGIFEQSNPDLYSNTFQFNGRVFWPPPVFAPDGYAYSFGPDGLIQLKVKLPAN